MRRIELNKAVLSYAKQINFYNLGLIRKVMQLQEARIEYLKSLFPKVKCPRCMSKYVVYDNNASMFEDSFFYCENCGHDFSDDYEMYNLLAMLKFECYINPIDYGLRYGNLNPKSDDWNEVCTREFNKFLNLESLDSLKGYVDDNYLKITLK